MNLPLSLPALEENGIAVEGGSLIVQRELHADGKNVCRVNGRPVTVAQLRQIGVELLNIHGQHDGQQLLDPDSHLGYLDSFGKTQPLLTSYQEAFGKVSELKRRINSLEMDEAERERRVETLTYQIGDP